jgi:DNA-binding GntR family transcriptional regulator
MTYREIADAIATRIAAGEWSPGDRLPTTEAIAAEYDCSEATAYRAMSLLVDRGVVRGERGRARFVEGQPTDATN